MAPKAKTDARTTRKGRLVHLDRFLIRRQNLKRFRKTGLSYLDVGCGAQKKGAPTTEDTLRDFQRAKINIELTAIDRGYPKGFKKHPKIAYRRLNITRKPIKGRFEIVRYANVEQHLPMAEREKALDNVANAVAENGFLIYSKDSENYHIFQKVSGKLVEIKSLKSWQLFMTGKRSIADIKKSGW